MQWLSSKFVKLGIAVLLIVGFVIRDDLFPSDHEGKAADAEVVAEVASQQNDQASESSAKSTNDPAPADSAEEVAAELDTQAHSEKNQQSASVSTQSADSAETGQVASAVAALAAESVATTPAATKAATKPTAEAVLPAPITESAKPLETDPATPSTAVQEHAQIMSRAQGDAESEMGSGLGSSFGSGFGTASHSQSSMQPQSAMNTGVRSETGMMGSGSSRKAYTGDDHQLKPGVNPVEVLSGARQAFWENRFADSAESYRVLLDMQPANWMAWGELGNVYYRKGEMEASGEAYYRSAVLMWHAHRYDEAWRLARIIGNLSPKRALDLAVVFYGDKAAGRSANPAPTQPSAQPSVQPLAPALTTEPTEPSPVSNGDKPVTDAIAK